MVENARSFLTKHAVRKAARHIIEIRRDPDPFHNTFLTAIYILETLMGRNWVIKRVFPKRASFLTPGFSGKAFNPAEAMMRAIELAESLLNLQSNKRFDNAIKRIKTDSLEPEMAALLVAKQLFINGRSFRFVEPVGQAKADYDLEIIYGDTVIACEVKCKLEATIQSYETILKTLKNAANKQLPIDMPNLIFMHLPPNWTDSLSWNELLDRATAELFRNHKRINGVFTISYKRFSVGSSLSATVRFTKAYIHPTPRNPVSDLELLFQASRRPNAWATVAELSGYSPNVAIKHP